MSENLVNGFKLGAVCVKPAENVLIVGGQTQRVEPKAMEVLVALAAAGENVVGRQELTAQVWPRGYVTDDVLNRCISNLRAALGDDPRAPRYIATVPRKGYRLASPVEPFASLPGRGATLVLPFQNLSPAGDDYLADGLTELLIARLSVALEGPVISRTTAMTFKHAQRDLSSIRQQLDVAWVIEGSVMPIGDQLQVVVQLIDAPADAHTWAETWTRPLGDTLTLLNEISREVTARIRTELHPPRLPSTQSQALTTDLLRQYLLGLQLISKRSHAALRQAIACFERVLQAQPDHLASQSALALCWVLLAHYGAVSVQEGFGRARELAEAVLRSSSEPQADALCHLAAVEFFYDWDFDRAEATIERGLSINPNHDIGLLLAADVNLVKRRNERAQSFMDRALAHDPLNIGLLMNSGDHLILQRRFGEAANALATALEIDAEFRPARLRLALALAYGGREAEALQCLDRARAPGGEDAPWLEYRAIVHGRLGRSAEAHDAARRLAELGERSTTVSPWSLARAWAAAGERERSVAGLEAALEARSSSIPFLGITPVLDPVRGLPSVRAIMQKAGLP